MACADAHDADINRLNAAWHITSVADFEVFIYQRPRLLFLRRVSHTLALLDAIVPYLMEADFGDTLSHRDFVFDNSLITAFVWNASILRSILSTCYRVSAPSSCRTLRTTLGYAHMESQWVGCFCDFHTWYGTENWELIKQLFGARSPAIQQYGAQRKESFSLKLTWLREQLRQMPDTANPNTLRQYMRCYILLMIGDYLMTDKLNN
ncbi:hypothetical protein Ahy_B10g104640 [Arachis hypogaea]|uniref:Uncharacterized protein n=1 Tax=Arachis hypogaea TaxID=3818 RepID=A0A444X613_ARAHY|nr:hypothetical protein Ahy_B10g104640 [Arachis hypogaea]